MCHARLEATSVHPHGSIAILLRVCHSEHDSRIASCLQHMSRLLSTLVQAFAGGDSAAVKSRLADGLVAHVTQSDGSTRQVVGSANYAAIVDAMDPLSANLQMEIPQIMTIEPGLVMAMFEVHAARYGRRLHNFSGPAVPFRR